MVFQWKYHIIKLPLLLQVIYETWFHINTDRETQTYYSPRFVSELDVYNANRFEIERREHTVKVKIPCIV